MSKDNPHIVVYKNYGGLWIAEEYPNEEDAIEAYEKIVEMANVVILAKRIRKHAKGG